MLQQLLVIQVLIGAEVREVGVEVCATLCSKFRDSAVRDPLAVHLLDDGCSLPFILELEYFTLTFGVALDVLHPFYCSSHHLVLSVFHYFKLYLLVGQSPLQ